MHSLFRAIDTNCALVSLGLMNVLDVHLECDCCFFDTKAFGDPTDRAMCSPISGGLAGKEVQFYGLYCWG